MYSATKAGLIGMTRSLARELGPRNITVNAIAPGYLDTEMTSTLAAEQKQQIVRRTPLGRLGTSDDVAGVAEFLASEEARFITGQVIVVDGGISCYGSFRLTTTREILPLQPGRIPELSEFLRRGLPASTRPKNSFLFAC